MTTHLIDGQWRDGAGGAGGGEFFQARRAADNSLLERRFAEGGAAEVEAAAAAARAAFAPYAALPDAARADFLRACAAELEKRGAEITDIAAAETALPEARLNGERGRTVGQLQMFADLVESGEHLDIRKTAALPDREPLPRPDLRLLHRPAGVVAVWGASNFPLAFSVGGGDTAAALAAGCPVIVKGHPAHPHTGELAARALDAARAACGLPAGVFSFIQGTSPQLSRALVEHPAVAAAGFTGSLRAGRALFDAACRRRTPIPFYAEMGSINPVFILPRAAAENLPAIAQGWAQSLALGGGQFCTNPGVVFCPAAAAENFLAAAKEALESGAGHTMLTAAIAEAHRKAAAAAEKFVYWRGEAAAGNVPAVLLRCALQEWQDAPALQEEMFGPSGVVVAYETEADLPRAAAALAGQLTITLWLAEADAADAKQAAALLPLIEQKAGRLLCNGFPTGVEVAAAMMHGGPYPAATYPATSVGALAIRRFLRAVCYQNFPARLLPPPLR